MRPYKILKKLTNEIYGYIINIGVRRNMNVVDLSNIDR
jgi:hypothetical protein